MPACCASITRWACAPLPYSRRRASGGGRVSLLSLEDLIGHIALESQRAQCMVVGEDLGTIAEGFRDRLTRAKITGMRVLWFERQGMEFVPPASYPPTSVACVATHDLATLAGWSQAADVGERLALGLLTLAEAGDEIAAGARRSAHSCARSLEPASQFRRSRTGRFLTLTAAAVHALIGGSGVDVCSCAVRRPCGRNRCDQFAWNGSRAPQLASQVGPGCRRRLRQPSGAGDPRGAGQGADVATALIGRRQSAFEETRAPRHEILEFPQH